VASSEIFSDAIDFAHVEEPLKLDFVDIQTGDYSVVGIDVLDLLLF
jgi:hypothetical protein